MLITLIHLSMSRRHLSSRIWTDTVQNSSILPKMCILISWSEWTQQYVQTRGTRKRNQKKKKNQFTLSAGNPLMDSNEPTESEFNGKHCKWCHFVISNPRESLLTEPSLKAPAAMALEHCLHDDLPDFAYSTTIFDEEEEGNGFEVIFSAKRMGKARELGLREIIKYLN